MSYPAYSRAERIADGVIHILGVGLAITAVYLLFGDLADRMGWGTYTATIIYAVGLLAMLGASAAYHLAAYTRARPILRRLDHAAIYMKIAGTFTPLSVLLGTAFGYVVLVAVWVLALFGAAGKLMTERGKMTTGWVPYVALGWVGIAIFIPLTGVLPTFSLWMMLTGGILYTIGVLFYTWESLRFANVIWHSFTLVASGCFFVAIAAALAQTT